MVKLLVLWYTMHILEKAGGFMLFFGILLALTGVLNYYLVKRLQQCISYQFPRIPKGIYVGLFFLFLFLFSMGFFRTALPVSPSVSSVLGGISGCFMGIFIYLFLYFVLCDLVLLILRLCKAIPKPLPHRTRAVSVMLAVVVALSTCCYGFIHVNQIQTVSYSISVSPKQMKKQVNLVLLSDLHLGSAGWEHRLEKVVEAVQSQKGDIICIAGDIFDSNFNAMANPQRAKELLQSLSAPYGVYASLGNHDAGETFPQMVAFLKGCNITLLDDKSVEIDNTFVLAGRLDRSPIGGYGEYTRKPLGEVLEGQNTALPVVMLEHNPAHGDSYSITDADLILSGHTHKGQIFPANLFTNFIYTVDYGYYRESENHPHRIITSGAGIWGMPMRVGTNSEIVTITLQ